MLRRARELGYEGDDPGDALARELHVQRLRSLLANGPVSISKAADVLMVGTPGAADHTASLVALADAATDQAGSPVFSARYRLFARATEGAFTCRGNGPHVSLTRHERCTDCGDAAFESGACKRCGAVYSRGCWSASARQPRSSPDAQSTSDGSGWHSPSLSSAPTRTTKPWTRLRPSQPTRAGWVPLRRFLHRDRRKLFSFGLQGPEHADHSLPPRERRRAE